MSSQTAPATLSELRTAFRERVRDASSTALNTIIDRFLNEANYDIHLGNPITLPYWAVRRGVIVTRAPYTTGTVAITTASSRTAVTGTSTLWTTTDSYGLANARVGGKMTFSGLTDVYEVSVVGGAGSITLGSQYTGDDLSGDSYVYFEDEYSLASDFGRILDLRMFSNDANIPLIGFMQFRRGFPTNLTRSRPRLAALVQLGFSGSTSARPRVIFGPAPDAVYSVSYEYLTTNLAVTSAGVEQTDMTGDTDEPILPRRYRQAIVYHALAQWYRDRKDDTRSQEAKAEYVDIMGRISGDTQIGQDRPRFHAKSMFSRRRRRGGNFETNGEFDNLRNRGGSW